MQPFIRVFSEMEKIVALQSCFADFPAFTKLDFTFSEIAAGMSTNTTFVVLFVHAAAPPPLDF